MADTRPHSYITPLAIRTRTARVQSKGLPIINLSFNESPYAPCEAVSKAIERSTHRANCYGNPSCDTLRVAIAKSYNMDAEQIVCGNGSEELLDIVGRCFARPGDDIVISEFGYIQFPIVANRVGANLIKAREKNFTSNVNALLAAITPKTTIVFIANPNNPTGTMIPVSELRRLALQLPRQVVLVIDMAYGEFAGKTYCSQVQALAKESTNIVITQTFSKAFGLAGLRVGWCYAPRWMIPTLYAARGMGTVNAAAQAGALAALSQMDRITEQVDEILTERKRVSTALKLAGLQVTDSCANFLMVAVDAIDNTQPEESPGHAATELANHLFDDAGILVNQTREAGLERFIRFSLSLPENNDRLLQSIEQVMDSSLR